MIRNVGANSNELMRNVTSLTLNIPDICRILTSKSRRERMDATQDITLKEVLKQNTSRGVLYRELGEGKVECFACGHRCIIGEGKDGICRVRFNERGVLRIPWGYVGALQLDPVEKKPFFHALPGSNALSFGMLGCDYHCGYCQNWVTSQALRDPEAISPPEHISPEEFVGLALKKGARIVT